MLYICVRWKNSRPFTADGNYRPLAKTRQQNISMQRQENLRWMSELSYVEEKEQWQEQINQLKKQLDFSVNICQTLMQDQQVKFIMKVNFLHLVFEAAPIFPQVISNYHDNSSFHRRCLVCCKLFSQVLTVLCPAM